MFFSYVARGFPELAVKKTEHQSILILPYVPGVAFQHSGRRKHAPFKVRLASDPFIRSVGDDRRLIRTRDCRPEGTAENQASIAARAAGGGTQTASPSQLEARGPHQRFH